MTTYVITSRVVHILAMTIFILKVIKSHFKGSYDKQNHTLIDISYKV